MEGKKEIILTDRKISLFDGYDFVGTMIYKGNNQSTWVDLYRKGKDKIYRVDYRNPDSCPSLEACMSLTDYIKKTTPAWRWIPCRKNSKYFKTRTVKENSK